ncbi:DUF6841 family protein [Williamsia sp. SKLECPSW1]
MASRVSTASRTRNRAATEAELLHWFFDEVLPRWDAIASGTSEHGDVGILTGFSAPSLLLATCDGNVRALAPHRVRRLVESQMLVMRIEDVSHILVPDSRVVAYGPASGALDILWSPRRTDGSELIRLAVHYDIARIDDAWRITAVHVVMTDAATLADVWTPTPSHEID